MGWMFVRREMGGIESLVLLWIFPYGEVRVTNLSCGTGVMISRDGWGRSYFVVRGDIRCGPTRTHDEIAQML